MMSSGRFHRYRRVTGVLLLAALIGMPFWKVHGESAFRFDIPSLRLLLFGTEVWLQDFFIVLIAVIFLTFLGVFITNLFGRLWCGWLCPQTVVTDATFFLESRGRGRHGFHILTYTAAALGSGLIAVSLVGYFVSPYDVILLLRQGGVPARIVLGSWIGLGSLIFLDIVFLRKTFCATVCPYAKLQSVLFDDRTLLVAFDPGRKQECMECNACLKACPVRVDIRKGASVVCIHCAECVDACTGRMALRSKKSLINYSFGIPGTQKRGFRPTPVMSGAITAVSLVFLFYLGTARIPFDVTVLPQFTLSAVNPDGSVVNSYVLSFRNMGRSDLDLDLIAAAHAGTLKPSLNSVTLRKGTEITKVDLSVTLSGSWDSRGKSLPFTLTFRTKDGKQSITKNVSLMSPTRK